MDWFLLIKAAMALIFVLGLLFLTIGSLKYLEDRGIKGMFNKNAPKRKRLEVLEFKRLDGKNALVLIRRDEAEHLLLIGSSAQVIEKNISQTKQESNNHE